MNYERAKSLLSENGQLQLLDYYGELSEEQRRILLNDIEKLNFSVVENINRADGETAGKISPARSAAKIGNIRAHFAEYEKEGLNLLKQGKVAAVLLAGGQGTRLGFEKPKGTFDMGVTRSLPIFRILMDTVKSVASRAGRPFPLFVMTSGINNDDTVAFFKSNNYFGYPEDKIHFYIQDTEPACDFDGKIFLAEKHRVSLSPNGNGGWYSSLVNAGFKSVLEKEGVEWINVFGVDNVLQKICDPAFIGATLLSGCACGAKVVSKTCPEERVGVLCERDGKPAIVEYYEMPPELSALENEEGELVYRYGVILNYLFKVNLLDGTIGQKLPYHLAKKAVPHLENGVTVKPDAPNGYKFETLVVDMVRRMGSCLAYEVEREREFAPVKNKTGVDSVDSARNLLIKNGIQL